MKKNIYKPEELNDVFTHINEDMQLIEEAKNEELKLKIIQYLEHLEEKADLSNYYFMDRAKEYEKNGELKKIIDAALDHVYKCCYDENKTTQVDDLWGEELEELIQILKGEKQ